MIKTNLIATISLALIAFVAIFLLVVPLPVVGVFLSILWVQVLLSVVAILSGFASLRFWFAGHKTTLLADKRTLPCTLSSALSVPPTHKNEINWVALFASSDAQIKDQIQNRFSTQCQQVASTAGPYQNVAKALLESDVSLARVFYKSIESAKNEVKAGKREIPGWDLNDVPDDGNCFYEALAKQFEQINHPILNERVKGTEFSSILRARVTNRAFNDREWANHQDIFTASEVFTIVIKIIDTRSPKEGYHFYCRRGGLIVPANETSEDWPVVRLAFTGNHFLSVVSEPPEHTVKPS